MTTPKTGAEAPVRPARPTPEEFAEELMYVGADLTLRSSEVAEKWAEMIAARDAENSRACRALEGELAASRSREEAAVGLLGRWMFWASGVAFKSVDGEAVVADTDAFLANHDSPTVGSEFPADGLSTPPARSSTIGNRGQANSSPSPVRREPGDLSLSTLPGTAPAELAMTKEEPCRCDPDYAHADTNDNGRTWFCKACRKPRGLTVRAPTSPETPVGTGEGKG